MSSEPLCPFVQESRDQIIMIRTPFRSTDRTIKFQNSRPQLTLDHELDQIKFGPKSWTTVSIRTGTAFWSSHLCL